MFEHIWGKRRQINMWVMDSLKILLFLDSFRKGKLRKNWLSTTQKNKRDYWIREQTKLWDAIKLEDGPVMSHEEYRRIKTLLKWKPRQGRRTCGRQTIRWRDNVKRFGGFFFLIKEASEREKWTKMKKA